MKRNDNEQQSTNGQVTILSYINEGFTTIPSIPNYQYLKRHLLELNLHSNQLTNVDGLNHLSSLKYLDLSSNNISSMDANEFWDLQHLVHLNLASNRIKEIDGISSLQNLKSLNLAYNEISSLDGLKQCSPNHALEELDLRKNYVTYLSELLVLKRCEKITRLSFQKSSSSGGGSGPKVMNNQVCSHDSYLVVLEHCLPSLTVLDGEIFLELKKNGGKRSSDASNNNNSNNNALQNGEDIFDFVNRISNNTNSNSITDVTNDNINKIEEVDSTIDIGNMNDGNNVPSILRKQPDQIKTTAIDRVAERVRSRLTPPRAPESSRQAQSERRERQQEQRRQQEQYFENDDTFHRLSRLQNEMRIQRLETRMALMQSTKARRRHQRKLREEAKKKDPNQFNTSGSEDQQRQKKQNHKQVTFSNKTKNNKRYMKNVVKTDDDMDDAMDTESERQRGNPWKKSQQKKKKRTASTLNASVCSKSKGKNISSNNNNEHVKYMPNLSINGAARQVEEITGQMIGKDGQIVNVKLREVIDNDDDTAHLVENKLAISGESKILHKNIVGDVGNSSIRTDNGNNNDDTLTFSNTGMNANNNNKALTLELEKLKAERDDLQKLLLKTKSDFNDKEMKIKEEMNQFFNDHNEQKEKSKQEYMKKIGNMEDEFKKEREAVSSKFAEVAGSLEQEKLNVKGLKEEAKRREIDHTEMLKLKLKNQESMFNSQMMELRSNLQAEQTQKRNQFEIEKAQINLKLEMEKNRAELSESSLKRCEDELLRTKLNLQNQIEKDETYYRDEIAKLKAEFKEELKEKEDSLDELKQQLYDISNLTNKKEYEYKHVLQEKQHEMQNIQEELNQREQMIQNINIGLLKAKDEASNTYSDYTKQNNRLKIALKQVQNAYEELFKKHTRVVKMYNKQLKQHDKTLEMVKNLKDVVEDQQQHIHRANVEYDEKEKKVRLEFKTRQEDMEAKEVEYKSTINELSLQKLNEITNMETKIKKIETEKHVLMSRIREITNNNIKSEGKCKEEKVKNNLLVERLKRADELIELEKEEKNTIMKVKDAMLLDKDDTIMKLKKDMALLKKDLDRSTESAQNESEDALALQEQLNASLEIREEMEEIIKNLRDELKADNFDGIRAELRQKEKIIRQIEEEMLSFRAHIDKSRKELKHEKKQSLKMTEEKNELLRQLNNERNNVNQLNSKMNGVEKENIDIKNSLEHYKNELLMNQKSLNDLKENADNSKRELNEYKRKAVFQRRQAAESLKKMTSLYETMVGVGDSSTNNNEDDQIHSP